MKQSENKVIVVIDSSESSIVIDSRHELVHVGNLTKKQIEGDPQLAAQANAIKSLELAKGLTMFDVFFETVGGNPLHLDNLVSRLPIQMFSSLMVRSRQI